MQILIVDLVHFSSAIERRLTFPFLKEWIFQCYAYSYTKLQTLAKKAPRETILLESTTIMYMLGLIILCTTSNTSIKVFWNNFLFQKLASNTEIKTIPSLILLRSITYSNHFSAKKILNLTKPLKLSQNPKFCSIFTFQSSTLV